MTKIFTATTFMLQSRLRGLMALAFILIALPFSIASATTYTTAQNGRWGDATTWKNGLIAPTNINNKDVIEILHKVSFTNTKINNGGTIIISGNGSLSGDKLDMNGNDSQITVEPGGSMNFGNVNYTNNGTGNFTVSNGDFTTLPVTLVSFNVKRASQPATTLEWITASETNNAYFAIEKSLDGKTFTEAGRVVGKNSTNGATYSFEDKNATGRAYYRLKQVDFDGKFTYSAIVVTSVNQKLAVYGRKVIFSNTFSGKLHLVNVSGLTVKTITLQAANVYELPENLNGLYILQLESGNQISTQRISL